MECLQMCQTTFEAISPKNYDKEKCIHVLLFQKIYILVKSILLHTYMYMYEIVTS